jgi:hypothetical protein
MRKNISLFFLFISVLISAQKKVTITVCIDGESRLHIKNGKLFWEHKTFWEPGTHESCTTKTTVNDKVWDNWKTPFVLNFNTNELSVETKILKKRSVSKLLQAPSAANNWETIWQFNDPDGGPYDYSVTFIYKELKKDTVKEKATVVSTPAPKKIDPPLNYTIAFKVNEDVLSKTMTNLFDSLLKTRAIYRISGFKTSGTLQLYEKRAQAVGTYLLSNGAKSVQYIGFGENKPLATKADTIDIIISDN